MIQNIVRTRGIILDIPDNLEPNKETKYVNVSKVKQIM